MADETKPPTSAPPSGATAGKPDAPVAPSAPVAPAAPSAPVAPKPPAPPSRRKARSSGCRSRRQDDHSRGHCGEGQLARSGRQLAARHAAHMAGHGVGRVFRGVGRGAGRDRPLHVPERAQRAAAAVQGGLSGRLRHGRRRALQGVQRRLDRAHRRRHRPSRERLLRAEHDLHAPRLHAELAGGRAEVQVPVPRQRVPARPASTSKARRRGRWSAIASCSPRTARS